MGAKSCDTPLICWWLIAAAAFGLWPLHTDGAGGSDHWDLHAVRPHRDTVIFLSYLTPKLRMLTKEEADG